MFRKHQPENAREAPIVTSFAGNIESDRIPLSAFLDAGQDGHTRFSETPFNTVSQIPIACGIMETRLTEQQIVSRYPWVEPFREGLAENDYRIRTSDIRDGWELVRHRGEIFREAIRCFFQQIVSEAPPSGAFAIHSLGGTGRREVCPGSDVDIGILVDNVEENGEFFGCVESHLAAVKDIVPGMRRAKANAFHQLDSPKYFDRISLTSLLDADLLLGDVDFDQRVRRVGRQRAAEMGLNFIFEVNRDLTQFDKQHPQPPGDVRGFHVKNGIGGLRNFHMTMWLYSFERWIASDEVYDQARSTRRFDSDGAPMPHVLDAVGILFSARCWIEQRRMEQRELARSEGRAAPVTSNLMIDGSDMESFLDRFGAGGLTQLNQAREIISSYRRETFDRLLEHGVVVPETDGLVIWGLQGLRIGADGLFHDATETFFRLYESRQKFHLEIDPKVKRAARKNIAHSIRNDTPEFIHRIVAPQPVLPLLTDWLEFGVLGQMIPGFDALASRLYQPGHRSAALTRAARAVQRIENLEKLTTSKESDRSDTESFFHRQYHELGDSARCALRLALLTEEIPKTLDGVAEASEESVRRFVGEQLSSINALSGPTLCTIEFLMLMKRKMIRASETSSLQYVLDQWHERIDSLDARNTADTIRALALFAYAAFDFHDPPGVEKPRLTPEQWRRIRNLAENLLHRAQGVFEDTFDPKYFDETGQRIGQLLPRHLVDSPHINNSLRLNYEGAETLDPQRAHRIIHALQSVYTSGQPKVELRRAEGFIELVLFAWDFPGLFWRVAGAMHDSGCAIRSTDLYNIPSPGGAAVNGETLIPGERCLVFDVLTFDQGKASGELWEEELRQRIVYRLTHPDEQLPNDVSEILTPVRDQLRPELTDLGDGRLKFSSHSPPGHHGVRYAISRLLSEIAGASVQSITQDGTHDWPVPRFNFYVHVSTNLHEVKESLTAVLGEID